MKLKQLLTGALISLVTCITFAESQWHPLDSANGFIIGADIKNISNVTEYSHQTNKKVWIKSVVYEDLIQDGLAVGDYYMTLYWVNCNNRTLGVKSVSSYIKQKNGTVKNNTETEHFVKMNDVIPNSIGEGILDTVCS